MRMRQPAGLTRWALPGHSGLPLRAHTVCASWAFRCQPSDCTVRWASSHMVAFSREGKATRTGTDADLRSAKKIGAVLNNAPLVANESACVVSKPTRGSRQERSAGVLRPQLGTKRWPWLSCTAISRQASPFGHYRVGSSSDIGITRWGLTLIGHNHPGGNARRRVRRTPTLHR